MISMDVAKRARASPTVNGIVRRGLRVALRLGERVDLLARRWRVSGTTTVVAEDARFRMLGVEDDPLLDALFYGRNWEPAETQLFAALAAHAGVVLDLGANTGIYSLLSTHVSPSVRVIAVEPSPANAERLRSNLRLNAERRVTPVEAAVGAIEGTLELTVPADGSLCDVASGVDAFSRAHYAIAYTRVPVALTTVDRLVDDHGLERVDLIKLDVEYFELEVLRGAARTLARFEPVVLAEIFDYDIFTGDKPQLRDRIAADNSEQVEALMAAHGYAFFAVGERGVLRVPTLRGIPNGGSNYLFVKHPPERRYIPYGDVAAIRSLIVPSGSHLR